MPRSASTKRGAAPSRKELESTLAGAAALWDRLHAGIAVDFGPLDERWTYSQKTGHWSLQLKQRKTKRTVLYLIACPGLLRVGFALGEKVCAAARGAGLPARVLTVIDVAPRYAEGRGVWLEVRSARAIADVRRLAAFKMAN